MSLKPSHCRTFNKGRLRLSLEVIPWISQVIEVISQVKRLPHRLFQMFQLPTFFTWKFSLLHKTNWICNYYYISHGSHFCQTQRGSKVFWCDEKKYDEWHARDPFRHQSIVQSLLKYSGEIFVEWNGILMIIKLIKKNKTIIMKWWRENKMKIPRLFFFFFFAPRHSPKSK